MSSKTYTLQIDTGDGDRGRSFTGVVLAIAVASGLHPMSQAKEPLRPVLLALACSAQETRPLLENLRAGRKSTLFGHHLTSKGEKVELCRSTGYLFTTQQTECGSVITAHVPDLFDYNPGLLEADEVRAVVMPAVADAAAIIAGRDADVADAIAHMRRVVDVEVDADVVGLAAVVCRYLAQRCELPIPPNLAFSAQLFNAARAGADAIMSAPLKLDPYTDSETRDRPNAPARQRIGFRAYIDPRAGIHPGVGIRATPAQLETLLSEQTRIFEKTRRASKKTSTPDRRATAA